MFNPGDRITHKSHGPGVIVVRDVYKDTSTGQMVDTSRLGVIFDQHTLLAKPAFFWPQELQAEVTP